jgi:hypothetical protein
MLKKFFYFILKSIFHFEFLARNNSRQVNLANNKIDISSGKPRRVTFKNSVTVINIDNSYANINHQKINTIFQVTRKRKSYKQVQTYQTFEQGMQRMKDEQVENQFYTYR